MIRTNFAFLAILFTSSAAVLAQQPLRVTIEVDAGKPFGKLTPIWKFFGADEPNYAYMTDGRRLLGEIGKLGPDASPTWFRAHNLLSTGDGTPALKWGSTNAYTEDANGNPVYDWTIVDRIFDAYRDNRVKPYVQIGFMPKALSTKPEPYQHSWTPKAKYDEIYTGWAYPPKDYGKWSALIEEFTKHLAERYGHDEAASWYWETWNEPNIGYWRGTPEEFYRLHDHTVAAIRKVLPNARVGGPDAAGGGSKWFRAFLEHCVRGKNHATGETGTPTDFIAFHAKGAPRFEAGHVRMGIANQLRDIDSGIAAVASFPELKDKPIVIGESDPDGCAACQGPQLGYRNSTMYSSYTAASFARKFQLADRHGVNLAGALTWAFEFEDQPAFAGFRVMSTRGGIDLPVLNVFRMMAKMSGQRVQTTSSQEVPLDAILKDGVRGATPDVAAMASAADDGSGRVFVLAWHYHDDDIAGPDATVELKIAGVRGAMRVTQYLVDETHANAFTAWKSMGSPAEPTPEQQAKLQSAAELRPVDAPPAVVLEGEKGHLSFPLRRQGVTLFVLEPAGK